MRITAARIRNFKQIRSLDIDCDRAIVILSGKNGAGKSSALDGIQAVLCGARSIPAEPIRRGETEASVELGLGDVTVTRTFKLKEDGTLGGSLTIRTADGMKPTSPQAWLDSRLGDLSCDPVAFLSEKPEEQAKRLRKITGVDTTALDAKRKAAFDARTDIGRRGKDDAGALAALPTFPDAPKETVEPETVEPVVVSALDILAEIDAAEATQTEARNAEAKAKAAELLAATRREQHAASVAAVARLERELSDARELQKSAYEAADKAAAIAKVVDEDAAKANGATIDPTPIRERLAAVENTNTEARKVATAANVAARQAAEATNAKVRANAAHAEQSAKVDAGRKAYAAKTLEIDGIDKERTELLAKATFPVAGLGFDLNGGVTLDSLPFEQASQAARVRVSMAIALAANPEIRVVLVRDAALLDEDSMALVAELAEAAGAQVWLERVGRGDAGAIVIADGGVVS